MNQYNQPGVEAATVKLLAAIGIDPVSPEVRDTPQRVGRAWLELTQGYREDPAEILGKVFEDPSYDEMVLLDGIDFYSTCEHHLLPFAGHASVAYIPKGGRIVGISKLARLVDCFARRLQMQERMTVQIGAAIEKHLRPLGVGVVMVAQHQCLGCRGARKPSARMLTSDLRGAMRDHGARMELLVLRRGNGW